MSIVQKVVEAVVSRLPAADPDPVIGNEAAVGRSITRVDGPLKVTGTALFTGEEQPAGMVYAGLALSTIARGRTASIDTAEALAVPGVITVITHENAPRMKAPPVMDGKSNSSSPSGLPVMQDDSVRWNGQPIAVVVAETQGAAWYAASLIRATYAEEAAALSFEEQLPTAKPPKDILGEPAEVKVGDAEAALAASSVRIDAVYQTPRHYHAAMEPHAVVAEWHDDDTVTLHDSSQTIDSTRWTLAQVFGLKEEDIRVLARFVGGAFGNKGVWQHQILALAAARTVGRPVKLVLTREQVFRMTGARTLTCQRVALGLNEEGTLTALIHTGTTGISSHGAWSEQFSFPGRHLYAAENMLIGQDEVELDMVANTAMRAPGESIGTFALESALDELAHAAGVDPIDLRRRIEPRQDPTTGKDFSSRHLNEAYARGAERFGWAERNPVPRHTRDGDWWVGQGVATAYYPYYRMPGGTARIRLTADGRAIVEAAAHEMGMGTATVQAQASADRLGLPVDRVTFVYGDSALPASPIAGGSSQTATIVASVAAAAEALTKELLKFAGNDSPLAGAGVDDVVLQGGGVQRTDKEGGETYVSILSRAGRDEVACEAAAPMPAEMMQFSMQSTGAQFCEVRVNEVTGEIRVSRFLGSFDTGRILNPMTARSQFLGGITMGLGLALTEEMLFDERTGRFANANLAEYHVPVHADVPRIEVIWNDIPDPHAPLGLHGIGEIGITGVGAAVANAVFNATGRRIRSLPLTLDKVLAG